MTTLDQFLGPDKRGAGKPESGKPESGKPESGKPESGKPEKNKIENTRPDWRPRIIISCRQCGTMREARRPHVTAGHGDNVTDAECGYSIRGSRCGCSMYKVIQVDYS